MTHIFITGGGRGIGRELVAQSLDKGWRVSTSVRSAVTIKDMAADFPGAEAYQFDVTDFKAVEAAAASVSGEIDILINNAGIIGPERQSTEEMDFDGFRNTFDVNVLAPLKLAQVFAKNLQKSDNPRLINISSQMGRMHTASSDRIAYRASKSALNKVTQALATDLEPDGISCIAMHPGWVRSDMGGPAADISPQESAAGILNVAENLSIKQTGQFIDWNGAVQSW